MPHFPTSSGGVISGLVESAVNRTHSASEDQHGLSPWVTKTLMSLAVMLVVSFMVQRLFSPRFDQHEPPVLKHWIPFVGHIIDLIRYRTDFLPRLA